MIQMGLNLLIKESKNELVNLINNQLNNNIPVALIYMNLQAVLPEIKAMMDKQYELELKEYNKKMSAYAEEHNKEVIKNETAD